MNLKAIVPFLLSLLLLVVVILIDRSSFNRMQAYTARVDQNQLVIYRLERVANYLKSAQVYSTSFEKIAPKKYYQLYKQEAAHMHGELTALQQLVRQDSIQKRQIDLIRQMIRPHWATLMNKSIGEIIQSGEGWRLNDLFAIHQRINQAIDHENNLLRVRKQELTASIALTNSASTLFSILAVAILLAAFVYNAVLNHRRQWLENFLESILNTSGNAIIHLEEIWDRNHVVDFNVAFANAAITNLLRVDSTAIVGKRVSELPDFRKETELIGHFIQLVDSGQAEPFELRYQRGDRPVWLYVMLARLDQGLTVTFQDITALKQYQHDLQSKIEQLHRSNENLQQFAYVASHDLQEPLRKIQTFGDLLKSQYSAQLGEGTDYLNRMQSAASRMSTLIKDLLGFSRISTQQNTTEPTPLLDITNDVLIDLDLRIQETGAVIEIAPLPTVQGDKSQLKQLFQNLLSNALKFYRKDPSGVPIAPLIRVSSQEVGASDLPPSVKPSHLSRTYYRVDVSDNGIGFDNKYVDRIFHVFQRLHGKNEFVGTGIGLAICEKIAANHGGAITARSQVGQGSTFSVYFPESVHSL